MDLGTANNYIQLVIWIVGGIVWVRKMRRDKKLPISALNQSARLAGYGIMAGLVISSFSLYFNFQPRIVERVVIQTVQQPPKQRIITGWGYPDISHCVAILNSAPLMEYSEKYDVAVVCGIIDPKVDKYQDQRITISQAFTIRPGAIDIETPSAKSMLDAVENIKKESLKGFPAKKGTKIRMQLPMWYEAVLIPKGMGVADIRKLADVPRYGGRILPQEN